MKYYCLNIASAAHFSFEARPRFRDALRFGKEVKTDRAAFRARQNLPLDHVRSHESGFRLKSTGPLWDSEGVISRIVIGAEFTNKMQFRATLRDTVREGKKPTRGIGIRRST